ncbi:MAG: beta-mannosidase [Chitinophagaceae bacterium]|nr:MAG: beta-mannosidase [Chitinophagaceae bacterium]
MRDLKQQLILTAFALLPALVWANTTQKRSPSKKLVTPDATVETKNLYGNLDLLSARGVMFGHQDATSYGHGWTDEPGRSDVKSVTGSHPAVIGIDFGGLGSRSDSQRLDYKSKLIKNITDTYNRGGVVTVAWHFSNPVSPTGFYWNDSTAVAAVPLIIPGGVANEKYKQILAGIAGVAKELTGKDGKLVPVIFRPYHEMDGDWFWWGRQHCSAADFKTLWQFTVGYLRDTLKVRNFIYAFSPDCRFTNEAEFLERYPGDAWVDMIGMDNYHDFGRDGRYDLAAGVKKLRILGEYGRRSGKLVAFTETGLEGIPDKGWWTETLLATIRKAGVPLAYVLVWRNDSRSKTHYYAPYPGHSSVPDFMRFYDDPFTIFENDLPGMYANPYSKK